MPKMRSPDSEVCTTTETHKKSKHTHHISSPLQYHNIYTIVLISKASNKLPSTIIMAELSPKSMAEAAYTNAVTQMKNKNNSDVVQKETMNQSNDNNTGEESGVVLNTNDTADNTPPNIGDITARIENIWQASSNKDANLEKTINLLVGELDNFIQCGLSAFKDLDSTQRQLTQARELAETKSREAARLQSLDEENRQSLSNLLRAVESSKAEARNNSRNAQVEARLCKDMNDLRDDRDKALIELNESRRKQSLLEEELRMTKTRLTRVSQEKNSMERDSRAAISLARSLDNNNSNDMNYYKRKVGELSDKLQSSNETIAKQNQTIAELRGDGGKQGRSEKRIRKSY